MQHIKAVKKSKIQMILMFFVLFVLSWSVSVAGWFGPTTYNECILEYMDGVKNKKAIRQVKIRCRNAGKSESWFGLSGYDKCVLENMEGVESDSVYTTILRACRAENK